MKQRFAFKSKLGPTIARYLELNIALGRRYTSVLKILRALDRFVNTLPRNKQDLTCETFHSWCEGMSELTTRTRYGRMLTVRKFCLYRRRTLPDCFVPDPGLFPRPGQTITPYIFAESEVAALIKAASTLQRHYYSPLRPEVLRLAVVLLFTTGVRLGELLRLVFSDFDLHEGTLLVRSSKFHKSRILPLHHDVVNEIKHHLDVRRRYKLPNLPTTPMIWNQQNGGKAYTGWGLQSCVWVLLDACNIRTRTGRRPRMHDFRHSFAVNALVRWYRADVDVRTKLPFLAAYLGHVSIISTYHYLHFVEPLRALASKRFDDRFGRLIVPLTEREGQRA